MKILLIISIALTGIIFSSDLSAQDVGGAITGADPGAAIGTAIGVAEHTPAPSSAPPPTSGQATGLVAPETSAGAPTEPTGVYYEGGAQKSENYYQDNAKVDGTYKPPAIESPEK